MKPESKEKDSDKAKDADKAEEKSEEKSETSASDVVTSNDQLSRDLQWLWSLIVQQN